MTGRIQKSIKNAKVNVIFYVITAVLAFFSRKVFLDNLGTEFLGLSSTLGDILNLMNITELGIGTAVGVTLYKPLFNDEREKISDIISVYNYFFHLRSLSFPMTRAVYGGFHALVFSDIPDYIIGVWFCLLIFCNDFVSDPSRRLRIQKRHIRQNSIFRPRRLLPFLPIPPFPSLIIFTPLAFSDPPG